MHASGRLHFALMLEQDNSFATEAGKLSAYLSKVRQAMSAKIGVAPKVLVSRGNSYQAAVHEAALSAGIRLVIAESLDRFVHPLVLSAYPVVGNPNANFPATVLNQPSGTRPIRALRIPLDSFVDSQGRVNEQALGALRQRVTAIDPNVVFIPAFSTDIAGRQARRMLFPNRVTGSGQNALARLAKLLSVPVYAWMPGAVASQNIERVVRLFEDLAANVPIAGVLLDPHYCLGVCPTDTGLINRPAIERIRAAIRLRRPAAELVWAVPEEQLTRGDFYLDAALADRFLVTRNISANACSDDLKADTWARTAQTGGFEYSIMELSWNGDTIPEWTLFDCVDRLRIIGVRHYGVLIPSLSVTGLDKLYTRTSLNSFPYRRNDL
jgi:hypothetical protein